MARFSHVALVYMAMAVAVFSAGVVPFSQAGVATVFLDDGGASANAEAVGGGKSTDGMLDNLVGPVRNALNTVTGGAILAVWGAVSRLLGLYAWPLVTASYVGAPDVVVAVCGLLVAAFTLGGLRVLRSSI